MIIFHISLSYGEFLLVSIIDKNKKFCIEIGKPIPNRGLVLNYEKTH